MNQFDNDLQNEFTEKVSPPDFEKMWVTIQQRRDNVRTKMFNKQQFAAAAACIAIIGAFAIGGGERLVAASESLINQVFGSKDELKKADPYAGVAEIQDVEEYLQAAEKEFTKVEFQKFSILLKEFTSYVSKMTYMQSGVRQQDTSRLNSGEQARFYEVQKEIEPYLNRLENGSKYTIQEAQKIAKFPITHPAYIPAGYVLERETAKTAVTAGEKNPIVRMEYKRGEFGFTIVESLLLQPSEDEFSLWPWAQIEKYKADNHEIQWGKREGSNIQGMKLIVPKTSTYEAHQIFILADTLSKDEMQKILLSIVKL